MYQLEPLNLDVHGLAATRFNRHRLGESSSRTQCFEFIAAVLLEGWSGRIDFDVLESGKFQRIVAQMVVQFVLDIDGGAVSAEPAQIVIVFNSQNSFVFLEPVNILQTQPNPYIT